MKNYLFFIYFIFIIACTEQQSNLKVLQGNAIGTTYTIKYLDSTGTNFELKIDSIIKAVNTSTSTYIQNSDISKINRGDTTVVVDAIFEEVFKKSEKIYRETAGDFDPTVGILVNAWGFGPGAKINNLDSLKIDSLLTFVGFNKVNLLNNKVSKLYPEIYFDFNAIGKGYLVDIVARQFEAANIENYMVEIGGEIRVRGKNEHGEFWKIAIENPNEDGTRSFATVIQLKDEAMATSGNYRKYRTTEDGKKYVHTINAKTGYATESNLLSASVISKGDCADVDGYATAFMAMGLDKSIAFIKQHTELKVFLIYANENGEIKTFASANFDN
ncbi:MULTISPECIES: FAD:protein FMN transferase [Flavobacteriaceae]|uniref:FAD:protein FMN transferase n=2 Tax=Flavobacteriaceae TaxID=49546 RepID=A0A4Y8AR26_9FLAO|nr:MULTISPECIES: FAD:protein FMN transferase [Flavobacteriaceae]TEW73631.1 FAD:protein FMN transferase [Gramella jeungdoensis]GGK36235.1 FAD:protein FMN transferase [Lutibacter litoralis]